MLSTLLNYRYYANNLTKSLDRIQQTGTVASDTAYYDQNIGKVKDVDGFLDDYRLYTYALKAYGLEDQASSKGFIRKVIESDLTDKSSFANALADDRYRKFAEAFSFKTAEVVKTVQGTGQNESLIEAYSEFRVRLGTNLAAKTSYFQTKIETVTTAEAFVNDQALFDVAMRAIGVDPAITSKSYVRGVLDGTIPDNTATTADDVFFRLADKLNFKAGGVVPSGEKAMTADNISQLIYEFNVQSDNLASSQSAAHETQYYADKIGLVRSATALVNDTRLFEYVRTAFNLTDTTDKAYVANMLSSDLNDPNSAINQMSTSTSADVARKQNFIAMRKVFTFDTAGNVPTTETAQTPDAQATVTAGYYKNYQVAAEAKDATRTSTYKLQLSKMKSLSDLLTKDAVFGRDALDYVLRAFDLDPKTESITRIRRVLQSDVSDPNSYVNKLGDERYEKLAAAFNFDSTGKVRAQQQVQSTSTLAKVGAAYMASFGTDLSDAKKEVLRTDTTRYVKAAEDLRTLDDVLGSKTVLDYTLKAFGLKDAKLSTGDLKKLLTSDLGDRTSFAYSFNDSRYVDFAASFNFDPAGLVKLGEDRIQQPAQRLSTENLFLLTTMEQEAGEGSEGTRLALYFLRHAPELTTPLKILADKAVVEVVKTALGLPDAFSQLDIDKQAAILSKRIDLKDFQDPKKLDQFISRFTALYDMNNTDASASSPVLGLFSGSSSGGILGLL